MISVPWDVAPSHEQLFVLVTGANSGIGFSICERLIDEFLDSRSLTSHLILIPTTRSVRKSRETIISLRDHLYKRARTSSVLKSRVGPSYNPQDSIDRVHLFSIQLDLCDLPNVYAAADQLVNGTISDPTAEQSQKVRLPRLDVVIFNAGFGNWTGVDWPKAIRQFFTEYLIQLTTYPAFKAATAGTVVTQKPFHSEQPSQSVLGKVFCSNVFGHYLFAHELLPLLSRAREEESPGRIIWTSSIEPQARHFRLDDFQGIQTEAPYESSKRLTDVLTLTHDLPGVRKHSDSFFHIDDPKYAKKLSVRPVHYDTHPGVVGSTLFPLNFVLYNLYLLVIYLARWFGSPWHPITAYKGACAPVWLALEDDETLNELSAPRIKWGSSASRLGYASVKKTEVPGWGWEGKVEDREALAQDPATGVLRKIVGRKPGALDLTEEMRDEFEGLGAKVWQEMERLRHEWEGILGIRKLRAS